jgi:hypothetical protein
LFLVFEEISVNLKGSKFSSIGYKANFRHLKGSGFDSMSSKAEFEHLKGKYAGSIQ